MPHRRILKQLHELVLHICFIGINDQLLLVVAADALVVRVVVQKHESVTAAVLKEVSLLNREHIKKYW